MVIRIFGIDPGLVHTGVVQFQFHMIKRHVDVMAQPIAGLDAATVAAYVYSGQDSHTFIEAYRPRSHFSTDKAMVIGVRDIHQAIPGSKVIPNTAVKKIVHPNVQKLFGFNKFQATHHQDLQAAGRIALLGMYKDPLLNEIITSIVSAQWNNSPDRWSIFTS